MAVTNAGNNVLADATANGIGNLLAASNTKVQDGTIVTITSNAVGSNANGAIVLTKSAGSILNLDSRNTYICTNTSVNGGTPSDPVIDNLYLSLKGAKLVITGGAGNSVTISPMQGDALTQVIYRSTGTTFNSKHPKVNLVGSTLVFEGGGDGHLSKHPNAIIENVTFLFKTTSNSDFVLGMHQNWGTNDKPEPLSGLRFISIDGNSLISFFTYIGGITPAMLPNNALYVAPDWTYDVAPVGSRPTALKTSHRRASFTADATSYFGAVSINPTYLWIDPKTTLSSSGVLNSTTTHLRSIEYITTGAAGGDNASYIVAFRFKPTLQTPTGAKIQDAKVSVVNTNALMTSDTYGAFRSKLSASGYTGSDGMFVVTEPTTKDYTSNASYLTDSLIVQNRTRTQAWHKWWEDKAKLIIVHDSRNTTGTTAGETYLATDYRVSYRKAGVVFVEKNLDMSAPQTPTETLETDISYNSSASTANLSVSYASGVTTLNFGASGDYTLDSIYKAIIDFHATQSATETRTVLPVVQNNGKFEYDPAKIVFTYSAGVNIAINNGTKITRIVNAEVPANVTINDLYIEGNVTQATPTNLSNVVITGTLTYSTNTNTSITITNTTIGTVANSGTGIVTITPTSSSITTYTDAEINFLDSSLSAVGITSATIYQTESNRDTGTNPGETFTSSLDFKYGSVVSGVTMQNTIYLRVTVESVTLFAQITLVTGSNILDLGVQGQLSSINAKVDLTAKETTVKTDLNIINNGIKKSSLLIPHTTDLPI